MKKSATLLYFFLLCLFVSGCDLPNCYEGTMICAVAQDDGMQILQSNQCTGDTDCGPEINAQPCMLYQCRNDNFEALSDGFCNIGSRRQNGLLECTPRCEHQPAQRCKVEDGQTIVQTCHNESNDMWVTSLCSNSCKPDPAYSDYAEDGFNAGECGECRNDMRPYCDYDTEGLVVLSCENGTLVKDRPQSPGNGQMPLCPNNYQTRCESGYVYTLSDRNNCGGCGVQCTGEEQCIHGSCRICDEDGYLEVPLGDIMIGTKTTIHAYCIHNADQLKEFHEAISKGEPYPPENPDNAYVIVEDIEYTDEWTPLGTTENPVENIILLGAHKKLSFTQPIRGLVHAGIFGHVVNAIFLGINIDHVQVEHVDIPDPSAYFNNGENIAAGGLVASLVGGYILNSHVNATIKTPYTIGGLIGYAVGSNIYSSTIEGEIITEQLMDNNEPDPCEDPDDPCCTTPEDPCCVNPEDPCCTTPEDPCCVNPLNPCCTDPESPCCTTPEDPCCVNPLNPCCTDPESPCCTTPEDPCCVNPENPCCTDPESPCCTTPEDPCCVNPEDPCCTDPEIPCEDPSVPEEPGAMRYPIGGVIGVSINANFDNVQSTIKITANNTTPITNVGGLIGWSFNLNSITDSSYAGDINIPAGVGIGGLVGYASSEDKAIGLRITTSNFKGTITVGGKSVDSSLIGGLIGAFKGNGHLTINGSYVEGEITASRGVGGFVGGIMNAETIESMLSKGSVELIGCTSYQASTEGTKCSEFAKSAVTVNGNDFIGGLVGNIDSEYNVVINTIQGSFTINGKDSKDTGGMVGYTESNLDIANSTVDVKIDVTNENAVEESYGIAGYVGGSHNADLSIIGSIVQLELKAENSYSVGGMIGYTSNDHDLFGNTNFGNYSTLHLYNNLISGDISCKYSCGGMLGSVGYQGADSVLNAFVWANLLMMLNISGDDEIGGMVGHLAYLSFWDVEFGIHRDMNIKGKNYTGGISGFTAGAIEVNETTMDTIHVNGTDYVGGISGNQEEQILEVNDSILKRVFVNGSDNVGGLAGRINAFSQIMDSSIEQFTIQGQNNVGGLYGFSDMIRISAFDSIIQTIVSGENNVGGIIGMSEGEYVQYDCLVNTWVEGFNKLGGIAGEHKDYVMYIEDAGITGLISQKRPNESETDATYIGGIAGTGSGMIAIAQTYTFMHILPQAESNTIAGIYSGYLDISNVDYGSMVYWNESLDPIQLTGPDSTPSNEELANEAFNYYKDDNNELIFAVIPEDVNGELVDKVYTLANVMEMHSCTVKISMTQDKNYTCYTIPYPADMDALMLSRACIPEEMKDEICATTSPYLPDTPDLSIDDDDDDDDDDDQG